MLAALRRYLPELVLLANAGAFGVLLLELLILGHTDGIQRVAPVTAAAGAVLCVVSLAVPLRMRLVPAALLLTIGIAGVVGFARHFDEQEDFSLTDPFASEDDGDRSGRGRGRSGEGDDEDAEPPLLAPLSLSGTAALSAVAVAARGPRRD